MSSTARGVVINIHEHGATVRLEDGTLAAMPAAELAANRTACIASRERREPLDLHVDRTRRYPIVRFALERLPLAAVRSDVPQLVDPRFEERVGAYLKATQEWAPPGQPEPAERHFIRKKRRAAVFEARSKPT